MTRRRRLAAFTLIELMIAVAIIGILAAVAIPAFMKNARKAKTAEARNNTRRLAVQAIAYFNEDFHPRTSGGVVEHQFPEPAGWTPAGTCCGQPGNKCPPSVSAWTSPTWDALRFAVTDPHYYHYEFESTGSSATGTASVFTAQAHGDLDCDTVWSTFEMYGSVQSDGTATGQTAFYIDQDIE